MKKILRKRNGKLVEVYAFAVRYKKERTSSERKGCRHSPEEDREVVKATKMCGERPGQLPHRGTD